MSHFVRRVKRLQRLVDACCSHVSLEYLHTAMFVTSYVFSSLLPQYPYPLYNVCPHHQTDP